MMSRQSGTPWWDEARRNYGSRDCFIFSVPWSPFIIYYLRRIEIDIVCRIFLMLSLARKWCVANYCMERRSKARLLLNALMNRLHIICCVLERVVLHKSKSYMNIEIEAINHFLWKDRVRCLR